MDIIKNKKVLAIAGLVSLFLGIVLPYYSVEVWGYKQTIAVFKYWPGKLVLALIVLNILVIFKNEIKRFIPKIYEVSIGKKIDEGGQKYSLVPTILSVACIIYLTIDLHVDSSYVKNGLGFYLLWVGVALLVAHAFIYKEKNIESNVSVEKHDQVENNQISNTQYQNNMNYSQQTNMQSMYNQANMVYNNQNQGMNNEYSSNLSQTNNNTSMYEQNQNNDFQTNNIQSNLQYNNQNTNNSVTNVKTCPQCGKQVNANSTNCFMCGYRF